MDDIAALLAKFADAHGMSGYEEEVAALLRDELQPLVDDVRIDTMGNVIGVRAGDGPAVMVAAHMDEIGLMVSHIDNDGFLRVVPVGGWFDQTILSQRVLVRTRDGHRIVGVVGSRPPHVMEPEDRKKMVKLKEMFIDCGARSLAEAEEMGVEIGSPATIDRTLRPLGKDMVTGKAFDNRAGVTMMVAALRMLKGQTVAATIQVVGTVQEEVGLKGARTSAFGLDPDVAIATDVTIPGDHPGVTQNDAHVVTAKDPPSRCSTLADGASSRHARCFAGCASRPSRPASPTSSTWATAVRPMLRPSTSPRRVSPVRW